MSLIASERESTPREMLLAEIQVLRGEGCDECGDGPCGICLLCMIRLGFKIAYDDAWISTHDGWVSHAPVIDWEKARKKLEEEIAKVKGRQR